jgi:hypothetical protein
VIAREMGHIVAGHHDSNAGASIIASVVMNLIVPGSGLIKSVLSFAGSQVAGQSGRDQQIKEADEVAMKLLEAAGYTAKSVALNLRLNQLSEQTDTGSWANAFRVSARNMIVAVQGPQTAQPPILALEPASLAAPRSLRVAQSWAPPAIPPAPGVSSESAPAAGIAPAVAAVPPVRSAPAVAAPPIAAVPRVGRWEPDELPQTRPSGLPGPLMSGAFPMPVRTDE